jgi:selenocysteine lyase/cysteine desulfurase
MDLEQAAAWQDAWVRAVTERFAPLGTPLAGGELGIDGEAGAPAATRACAAALADVFGAEEGMLVRGAGTGALRLALMAKVPSRGRVLVHDPATYLTTRMTLEAMGVELVTCDFNSLDAVEQALRAEAPDAVLIQHMRPRLEDSYDVPTLVALARRVRADTPVLVDDNYAPLKALRLGCALGADVSAFSLFKHGGPEGVGCILGKVGLSEAVTPFMNSGGSIVQGPEAIEVVEALGRAALPTAMQSAVTREIAERLAGGEVAGIRRAIAGHCPETVVLVELEEPIASQVRAAAGRLGMATRPVGMESYHEVVPALLRPSKSLIEDRPGIERFVLRVSAMRAGADLVVDLLRTAIEAADA